MPPRQPPLDRIADALERIADALTKMSTPLVQVHPHPNKISKYDALGPVVGTMINPVTEAVHCGVCGLFEAVAVKHCMRRDCPHPVTSP
jgi:hypothetical protein